MDTTVEAFDLLVAINTRSPMIVAQEYARSLIKDGRKGSIVNVSKGYPGVKALANVSFTVEKGAVHGLMGEN
ncbi:SDR family NAD(P)-dependent oxidoreductase, partial [Rhizobium ruizarguesonis]